MLSPMPWLLIALLQLAQPHEHHGAPPERLGTVSFPIWCSADVQQQFTRAIALLRSFWYEEDERAFLDIARADPQCGMAWWGAAMSNYHEVWPSPYSPAELARGMADAAKAESV